MSFTGFGKFSPQQRKERQGVNPRTGQKVTIPAARVPKFSAGSTAEASAQGSSSSPSFLATFRRGPHARPPSLVAGRWRVRTYVRLW